MSADTSSGFDASERGSRAILDKTASLRAIAHAVDSTDKQIANGVKRVVDGEGAKFKPRIHPIPEDEQRDHALAAQSHGRHVHDNNINYTAEEIAQHAPMTSSAFASAARRASQVVADGLSKQPVQPGAATDYRPFPVNDVQAFRERMTIHAVHDPIGLLGKIEDGTLTSREVAAVKGAYPKLYAQMAKQLREELATNKRHLDYGRRLAIGTFLQEPATPSQSPRFIKNMQATYIGRPSGPPERKPRASSHRVDVASSYKLTGL